MIQKVEMYTVVCDNCGCDYGNESEYACWSDEDYVREDSRENDWITEGNKDYCSNCYSYDENDNLKLRVIE